MRTLFTICFIFFISSSFARLSPSFANGSNYDIIYHRISFSLLNLSSSGAISNGSVTTYFRTKVSNVTSLQFDLDGALTVSSATYHGSSITKSHNTSTDILTLTVPNIATSGTLDSVTVFYSGTPAGPTTSIPSGYNYVTHSTQKAVYTLDEAFTAHYWWPCKESLDDKIDSCTELVITAPNGYKVSSNGIVTEVVGATNTVSTWKTFYPIATYGINFAIANYAINSSTMVTGGQTLKLYNYLYPEDNVSAYQNAMTDMKNILAMYVSVLGVNYPFLNEQYGMTECTGSWGALEVQSMTFMARGGGGGYSKSTIAHELSHQWFGDMLTTNDWHQVWLNEGFAQYCESVIYPENMLSAASAATSRSNLKSSVNSSSTTYVPDISNADKIFFGTATSQPYEKGAMTLSMLRAWLGDTKFFLALKNYLNGPGIKYNFTSVDSLKKYMQAQTSLDMTNFFDDWVTKPGKVTYTIKYQYVTKGVYIQLTSQSPTSAGAGYFDMPVPLRIQNGTGLDTTIVIIDKRNIAYNNVTGNSYASNTIYFPLSQTPTTAPVFDPNNVVLATASISSSSTLNTLIVLPFKEVKIQANDQGKNIRLNWSIKTDEALESITLERSFDALDFTTLQTYQPVAYASNFYEGTYVDQKLSQQQYYRLKIIKKDGSVFYSKVENIKNELPVHLLVKPNPVRTELNIMIPSGYTDGEAKLLIYNSAGQILKEMKLKTGDDKVSLSARSLSPGIYNLLLINKKEEKLQANFIKE